MYSLTIRATVSIKYRTARTDRQTDRQTEKMVYNKLCAWRHYAPPLFSPVGAQLSASRSTEQTQLAVLSHVEYVPTLTAAAALRVKAELSKAALTLTFDLLTFKVVTESHVTWATSVPIVVFLGLAVLELGPMYASTRQKDVRQTDRRKTKASLNAPPIRGRGIIISRSAC